jgi:hypothetical protein
LRKGTRQKNRAPWSSGGNDRFVLPGRPCVSGMGCYSDLVYFSLSRVIASLPAS